MEVTARIDSTKSPAWLIYIWVRPSNLRQVWFKSDNFVIPYMKMCSLRNSAIMPDMAVRLSEACICRQIRQEKRQLQRGSSTISFIDSPDLPLMGPSTPVILKPQLE